MFTSSILKSLIIGGLMKKKKEEIYQLTFKGFVSTYIKEADTFLDDLELYLRRIDKNAVILESAGKFGIHKVYLEDK